MKYFGQYLVEKKLISEELLVQSLVEQLATLPSVCSIVKDKGLLNAAQILNAFELQSKQDMEFKQACEHLGYWSPQMSGIVRKEIESIRTPLGHILIKKGVITLTNLTKALDDFLSRDENLEPDAIPAPKTQASVVQASVVQASVVQASIAQPVPKVSVSNSAKDIKVLDNLQFPVVSEEMLREYSDFYSDESLSDIKGEFSQIGTSTDPEALLGDLAKTLHTLRGVAFCVRFEFTSRLLQQLEKVVHAFLNMQDLTNKDKCNELSSLGMRAVDHIVGIKSVVMKERNEKLYIEGNKDSLLTLVDDLIKSEIVN